MITKRTVLVLGAGASQPYGFPTGGQIAEELWNEDSTNGSGRIGRLLFECGITKDEVMAFLRAFKDSGQYSLDAFVQRRPQFRDIAKLVLAEWLIRSEAQCRKAPDPPAKHDWYRFLFANMMPPDPQAFSGNRLTVVTFNFDRSFEYRLIRSLQGNYGVTPEQAYKLAGAIPILHIHGQLGTFHAGHDTDREFGVIETVEALKKWAQSIRLIDDEIDQTLLSAAVSALGQADRVFFVGFSYHPDNLGRLQAQRLSNSAIWGTCQGMPDTECSRVYAFINSPRKGYLMPRSARDFFDVVEAFT